MKKDKDIIIIKVIHTLTVVWSCEDGYDDDIFIGSTLMCVIHWTNYLIYIALVLRLISVLINFKMKEGSLLLESILLSTILITVISIKRMEIRRILIKNMSLLLNNNKLFSFFDYWISCNCLHWNSQSFKLVSYIDCSSISSNDPTKKNN